MGYYTYYSLDVQGMKSRHDYNKVALKLESMNILNYAVIEDFYRPNYTIQNFPSNECVTWYNHDDDMIELSKNFPYMTFKLHGEGDSSDDMWDTYYKNGESETCQVIMKFPSPQKIKWGEDSM